MGMKILGDKDSKCHPSLTSCALPPFLLPAGAARQVHGKAVGQSGAHQPLPRAGDIAFSFRALKKKLKTNALLRLGLTHGEAMRLRGLAQEGSQQNRRKFKSLLSFRAGFWSSSA